MNKFASARSWPDIDNALWYSITCSSALHCLADYTLGPQPLTEQRLVIHKALLHHHCGVWIHAHARMRKRMHNTRAIIMQHVRVAMHLCMYPRQETVRCKPHALGQLMADQMQLDWRPLLPHNTHPAV